MAESMNLDDLRQRLSKLGVQIHTPPPSSTSTHKDGEQAPAGGFLLDRNKREVTDLLDRCNRVEAVLNTAQAVAAAGQEAKREITSPSRHLRHEPEYMQSSPRNDDSAARLASRRTRVAAKPKKTASEAPRSLERPISSPSKTAWPSSRPSAIAAPHTPLASVLAQYKEAEAQWTQEKAQLRREALTQRKRANKVELDMHKLERLAEHRALDVRTLKGALKARDGQLTAANDRIKQLEESLARVQDTAADRMASVVAERDDLKALLMATLQRLEAVESMVARADAASSVMQDKVVKLEEERMAAMDAAQRARTEAAELAEHKRRLQWQSKLLEKMSEVQLRHNKRKTEAIRELLGSEEQQLEALGSLGATTGESEGEEGSGAARLAGLRRVLQRSPA